MQTYNSVLMHIEPLKIWEKAVTIILCLRSGQANAEQMKPYNCLSSLLVAEGHYWILITHLISDRVNDADDVCTFLK